MSKHPTKSADNVYCLARLKAAEYNPRLRSREGAAEETGIGFDSLKNYELGICKVVPVESVIMMADAYNAPELLNHYCKNECPIRKDLPTDIRPIELVTIKLMNTLENSDSVKKMLMNIAEDGVISEDELSKFDQVMEYFERIENTIHELKLIGSKCISKG